MRKRKLQIGPTLSEASKHGEWGRIILLRRKD